MPRLVRACFLPALLVSSAAACAGCGDGDDRLAARAGRALQDTDTGALWAAGDTVVHGVLILHTTEGVASCEDSCKPAFAAAFGVGESDIGCLCPDEDGSFRARSRRRNLEEEIGSRNLLLQGYHEGASAGRAAGRRRRLRGLAEIEGGAPVAFSARVSGGLSGGAAALELLATSGAGAVASAFGVEESEVGVVRDGTLGGGDGNSKYRRKHRIPRSEAGELRNKRGVRSRQGERWPRVDEEYMRTTMCSRMCCCR